MLWKTCGNLLSAGPKWCVESPKMNQWELIKQHLAGRITAEGFENWVRRTAQVGQSGQSLIVGVPSAAAGEWMEKEYGALVQAAISELGLPFRTVRYETTTFDAENGYSADSSLSFTPQHLNPRLSFGSFVVGPSNQFAHAAAFAVSRSPARQYNPLFIYGGTGMGKTHLMQAMGLALSENFRSLRVVYTTSEKFMNQMIQCIKNDRMLQFHNHYRSADVLLIDDIHHIAGKERTQEEFFHTFNELHQNNKQIVVTSDSAPKNTPGLVDRLKSRFEWGLMVDIQPPDLETKMAILQRKSEVEGLAIPEDVMVFIATKTKSNVRELEGALVKLMAFAEVTGEPITLQMANQILRHLSQASDKRITIESIIRLVGEKFGLQPAQLKLKSNERKIAYPRQIAMYLAKELTHSSLPEIGRAFGGKHHTTVLHSVQKIEALRLKDADLNKQLHSLSDSLTA
jgi:chromosomal replication initiator protein